MDVTEAIRTRRSVRKYSGDKVMPELMDAMIEAARWAPSGLNNQPWRFMKIEDRGLIERLSELTRYRGVVAGASALIAVFLDNASSYDRTKDVQSVGASIQNMLLEAHSSGLGCCWMGEILSSREEVEGLLSVPDDYELMAVVALGYPAESPGPGTRHPVEEFMIPPPEMD